MANAGEIVVAFLSLSTENCVDQLIKRINTSHGLHCIFVKLTHQDLQFFVPQDEYDAVVLLHSISHGRNSITDVADAKYNRLLPTLKETYGPDRVGIIVHSMTSYTPVSKAALLMVFKYSQPTTFECSKCVIQCNNPAEMEDEHISRLIEFLKNAPHHEKPKPLLEGSTSAAGLSEETTTNMARPEQSHSSGEIPETKSTSASSDEGRVVRRHGSSPEDVNPTLRKTHATGTAGKEEEGTSKEGEVIEHTSDHADRERNTCSSTGVAPKELENSKVGNEFPQDNRSSRDMTPVEADKGDMVSSEHKLSKHHHRPQHRNKTSSDDKGYTHAKSHGYGQAASAKTQPSAPSKSTEDQHAENWMACMQNINKKGLVLAFVDYSRSGNDSVSGAIKEIFPQRSLVPVSNLEELRRHWDLYTAIFVDVGKSPISQQHIEDMKPWQKEMYNKQKVAILFPASTTGPISEPENSLYRLFSAVYFPYYPETGKFDDDTKTNLVQWLSDCSLRHDNYLKLKTSCRNHVCSV